MSLRGYVRKYKVVGYLGPAGEARKAREQKTKPETGARQGRFVNPISQHKSAMNKLYAIVREHFLAGQKNVDCHHMRGKCGTLFIDWRFFMAVSRDQHTWIDQNREEARAKGWLCDWGKWNKAPEDKRTQQLRDIMSLAKQDLAEAKTQLKRLILESA